jgi:formate dehydrogenase subunit gamma
LFAVALTMLFFTFVRGNFFQFVDIKWMLKGGGFFGGHVSSHRYNFGEKTWFWLATLVGLVMAISGVMLLIPWAMPDLYYLQVATVLHAIGGVLLVAAALGHIYIGTIGMEGALEGMTRGTVDENWALEHHDLWHEAHIADSTTDISAAEARAAQGEV